MTYTNPSKTKIMCVLVWMKTKTVSMVFYMGEQLSD